MQESDDLITLANQLAGVYDNREQAIEAPIWYVHLVAWWRPVPLFTDDSVTFFAEQANALSPDRPYRQRLMRLHQVDRELRAQFYQFVQPNRVLGAGQNPALVSEILQAEILELSDCQLIIQRSGDRFSATPKGNKACCFTFPDNQGNQKTGQVELGFESNPGRFDSYDKGINAETGQAIWGAIMGPYRFIQRQSYGDLLVRQL